MTAPAYLPPLGQTASAKQTVIGYDPASSGGDYSATVIMVEDESSNFEYSIFTRYTQFYNYTHPRQRLSWRRLSRPQRQAAWDLLAGLVKRIQPSYILQNVTYTLPNNSHQ